MLAVRLHGPRDLRVERIPHPGPPAAGRVLLRIAVTGLCGSDLHSYLDGRIGDTVVESPLTLGHEFSAVIEAVGPGLQTDQAERSLSPALKPGMRVAVDPAQSCGHCELCRRGDPNLCLSLKFCGNYPNPGCLSEWMHMPAACCLPIPDTMDDVAAAMLEPLGCGIHPVDLARLSVGDSLAILGAGPIGLCSLQVAQLAGARPIFVSDKFPWRLRIAEEFGAVPIHCDREDPVSRVMKETRGRGVDAAIEVAWGEESIHQAAGMARLGGRLVLVGIPGSDRLELRHSTARRKGLTIRMSRRMKHTYPRALELVASGRVNVHRLVTHRFPLREAVRAFELNAAYAENVVKVVIQHR